MPYRIDDTQAGDWPFRVAGDGVERFDRRRVAWVPCLGTVGTDGYPMVTWKPVDGPRRFLRLHVVVWITHRGPVPPGLEVDHIDGDKGRCVITNLQLLTHGENIRKARADQGNWSPMKLTPWQVGLVLGLPDGWRCLHQLAARWGVSKFYLGNMRAKAKKDSDLRYMGGL